MMIKKFLVYLFENIINKPLLFIIRLVFDISPIFIGPKNLKLNTRIIKIINDIKVNVYSPSDLTNRKPAIIYYHGGGWILGSLKSYGRILKLISYYTGYVVIGIEYKKAPKYKFPTAHNDALEGYKWVINNASLLNINKNRIAILGDSAGGNLAISVVNKIFDDNGIKPKALGLIYPFVDISKDTLNKIKFNNSSVYKIGYFLIRYILKQFITNQNDVNSAKISHLLNFKGYSFPNTLIIVAGIDPLKDSINKLYCRLKTSNTNVKKLYYKNSIHGFINFVGVSKSSKNALLKLCTYLKENLD